LSGSGTVALSNVNTYGPAAAGTVGTTLTGTGILQVGNSSALSVGDVSVQNSATLQAGGAITLGNNVIVSTGVNATLDNAGNTYTVSGGVISGAGGVAVTDSGSGGSVTLGGANTYTGGTTLTGGQLQISSEAATGGSAANLGAVPTVQSTNLILNGGDLLATSSVVIHTNRVIGIGPVSGATGATGLLDAASGQTLTVAGTISSAGNTGTDNLSVNSQSGSTGTVQLGGTNTYKGTTTVSAGVLSLTNSYALENSTLSPSSSGGVVNFGSSVIYATVGDLSGTGSLGLTNLSGAAVSLTIGSNNATTTYSGNLSGSGSLTKAGSGNIFLAGSNNIAGTVNLYGGTLYVNSGAVLSDANYNGYSGTTTNNGGYFTNTGTTYFPDAGGGFAQPAVGAVSTFGTLNVATDNGSGGGYFQVTGGTVNATSIYEGRSGLNSGATQPTAGSTATGLYFNGANLNVTGHVAIGDDSAVDNSSANLRLDNCATTIGGTVDIGLNNNGRWSDLDFNGGSLTVGDATTGVQIGNAYSGNAVFLVRGGTAMVGKITFGASGVASMTATLDQTNGALYIGSGGIVQGSTASGFVASALFNGGILGASNAWSSSMTLNFNGAAIMAADSAGTAHNITLSGAVEGTVVTLLGGGQQRWDGFDGGHRRHADQRHRRRHHRR
jgi:autotransporter-associated beta strand protein